MKRVLPDDDLPKNAQDVIDVAERILNGDENEPIILHRHVLRLLVALAKRARLPARRPGLTVQQKRIEWGVLWGAVQRKKQLIAKGKKPAAAAQQAAEEAASALGKSGRNVGATTLKRRMESFGKRRRHRRKGNSLKSGT